MGKGQGDQVMPDVCHVSAASLPWRAEARHGVALESKILGTDGRTGAATQILRLAPGFWRPGPAAFTADCEFYVLHGAFSLGDVVYGADSYAFLPGGLGWSGWHSRDGAVLLMMTDGPLALGTPGKAAVTDAVVHVDAADLNWRSEIFGARLGSSVFGKPLRGDADSPIQTFLSASLPHPTLRAQKPRPSTGVVAVESFCLSGAYLLPDGQTAERGSYAWFRSSGWSQPDTRLGYNLLVRIHRPRLALPLEDREPSRTPSSDPSHADLW
jgi:hypothetical protein